MSRVLGHDRDKGSDSERDCGRDSLSYMWASRMPSAATGSARCASSAEFGDDCRPAPPPVSRYKQPTPARHSRICANKKLPREAPAGPDLAPPPDRSPSPCTTQLQYRANLAECLGFDSDLSETSGISNKSYGFEPCVR
jgi:hypothetical protein